MEEIKEKLKGLAIIVPCLNPDEKLMQVVRGMLAQGFSHILVVNDGSSAEYQPLFDKRDEILEHPERYGETITTFTRTRVKDGFITLPVWIKDVTVAELAQCWQREEYKTTCEECGGEAYIAGWNGLYKMGRFGVFLSLIECCPTCKRVYERHKTIGPAGLLEEGRR